MQAVLGFPITIDPPAFAGGCVANVEITLSVKGDQSASLVALLPQEKTYNAAAVSKRSADFGGSAVAQVLKLNIGGTRRDDVFYLYRDLQAFRASSLRTSTSDEGRK